MWPDILVEERVGHHPIFGTGGDSPAYTCIKWGSNGNCSGRIQAVIHLEIVI